MQCGFQAILKVNPVLWKSGAISKYTYNEIRWGFSDVTPTSVSKYAVIVVFFRILGILIVIGGYYGYFSLTRLTIWILRRLNAE